jgi:hypothetical protein
MMTEDEEKQAHQAASKQHQEHFGKPPFSLGNHEVSISYAFFGESASDYLLGTIGGISAAPEVLYEGPLRITDGKKVIELAHVKVTRDYDAPVQLDGDDPFSRVVMKGSIKHL